MKRELSAEDCAVWVKKASALSKQDSKTTVFLSAVLRFCWESFPSCLWNSLVSSFALEPQSDDWSMQQYNSKNNLSQHKWYTYSLLSNCIRVPQNIDTIEPKYKILVAVMTRTKPNVCLLYCFLWFCQIGHVLSFLVGDRVTVWFSFGSMSYLAKITVSIS